MQQDKPLTADDLAALSKEQLLTIVLVQRDYINTTMNLVYMHTTALVEDIARATNAFSASVNLAFDIDEQSTNAH